MNSNSTNFPARQIDREIGMPRQTAAAASDDFSASPDRAIRVSRASRALSIVISGVISLAWIGCGSVPTGEAARVLDRRVALSQLDIVDCIVEGAVRQMGRGMIYQEQPRMTRTTEFECASMGGTFIAFDPASPNTVIEKWLPFAESGDKAAQHRLGLLYEGFMGAEPNYEKAARWYQAAVDQGSTESMYALAILYEKGLGVEQDMLASLELYRRASGVGADALMLSSESYTQIEMLKESLADEMVALNIQRDALQEQVDTLEGEIAQSGSSGRDRISALESLTTQLSGQLAEREAQLATLPTYRLVDPATGPRPLIFDFPDLPAGTMRSKSMGRYFALVIGNNEYELLPDLETPHNDAQRIAALLSDRFGFSTQLILNANEEDIKRAIYNLAKTARAEDNLLIYFAGHGEMRTEVDRSRMRGFWLPTNADKDQDVNWVDNWWVTDHLDTSEARRALVIADSCYGGVFSTDLPIGPVTGLPALSQKAFDRKLQRKSRFVLASGGNSPVLDTTGPNSQHSVFASAFIDILEGSEGPMSVIELYGRIFDRMYEGLSAVGLEQEPELRVIRAAGHQSDGDFYFVAGDGT